MMRVESHFLAVVEEKLNILKRSSKSVKYNESWEKYVLGL